MNARKSTEAALQAICEEGLAFHQAGRFDDARTLYKKVLRRNSGHLNTLHLFGVLCVQVGQPELGAAMLRRAVALDPTVAAIHSVLGTAHEALGRLQEALANYERAGALQPDLVDAHYNRAGVLRKMGRRAEAAAGYETAVALAPAFAEAHYNLGLVLAELSRPSDACQAYDRAIAAKPDFAEAFHNRGLALMALARHSEALDSFEAAVVHKPAFVDAMYSSALMLQKLDRRGEALAALDRTLALAPGSADAHYARGLVLHEMGRPDEGIESFDQALIHRPDHVETLFCRSLSLLLAGRFEEGWREYEWRLKTPEMAGELRGADVPCWRGEPLERRIIYLHGEQGLGDTLQFCRYAALISPPAQVILESPAPLTRLLASLPGAASVIARGAPVPAFDVHCSLLSLPSIFSPTLASIPADVPYLAANPAEAARWRRRLSPLPGLKVGLVWSGGQRPDQPNAAAIDRRRSIALDAMAPLAEVTGVTYVSLQKGPPARQASAPPPGMALVDFTDELDDFADTAALVEALDLVISVDTSVAHLAGALGKPVWLLNRFDTCWRWLLDRDDSPWYPTLRQFRQSASGDWTGVMQSVRDALSARIAGLDVQPSRLV
jgi:tetratricopeptide (TPR) repeat protein